MGFCTKCGKQLAEGEVCSCQSQQTVASSAPAAKPSVVNEVVDFFKGLKNPADAVGQFVDKSQFIATIIILAITGVITAIANVFYVIGARIEAAKAAEEALTSTIFGSTYYYATNAVTQVADTVATVVGCIVAFIVGIIAPFIVAALMALVYMLVVKAFDKASTFTFQKGMTVACIALLFKAPCDFVGSIIALIPFSFFDTLGGWVTSFGTALGVVLTVVALRRVVKNDNNLVWVYTIAAVVSAILSSVLSLAVAA